jgi:hypothetical protein
MSCIFVPNLINIANETELVKKFYIFDNHTMVNFVLIKLKFQVDLLNIH